MRTLLMIVLCGGILASCSPVNETAAADPVPEKESEQDLLLRTSSEVLALLKEEQYEKLAAYTDPGSGVLFSPYAYIDPSKNVILTREELSTYSRTGDKLFWGIQDGSGDSISLSLRDYGKKFIYTARFDEAELVLTDSSAAKGNMINNIGEVFAGCRWIEYYLPGHEAKYAGMDWCALRLIFKKRDGKFYLAGIVHDQWTV